MVAIRTGALEGVSREIGNVRFGSLADNPLRPSHGRFTPESGHSAERVAMFSGSVALFVKYIEESLGRKYRSGPYAIVEEMPPRQRDGKHDQHNGSKSPRSRKQISMLNRPECFTV
jgi:hypothetical protein